MDKILLVEDDQAISDLISFNLNFAGYEIRQAFSGNDAITILENYIPALILLDVMLPDMDGFELLEKIRSSAVPVIFLTARNSLNDKVKGLKLGAEDYIVKPFEAVELLARIEVVLRRFGNKNSLFTYGDLKINPEERTVKKAGITIDLALKEYELLQLLIRYKNKALTREKILELVWGYEYLGETRTVDIQIQRLRKKLDWDDQIKTVYKYGYRLEDKL